MNSYKRFLFYFFWISSLVFFYRTATFWMNTLYYETVHDSVMYGAIVCIYIVAFGLFLSNNHIKIKGVHAICLLWFLLILIVLTRCHAPFSHYLKCLLWPVLFEITYLFVKNSKWVLKRLTALFFIVSTMGLLFFLEAVSIRQFAGATNMIYFFVLTIPFLLLYNKKNWNTIVLALATIMALLSMKMSMMLSMSLFWIVIRIRYLGQKRNRAKAIILSVGLLLFVVISFVEVNKLTNGFLIERIEREDQTNGRDVIFEQTFLMQMKSSTTEWVLGHGHNGVRADSPMDISAHNEWLEILYDYGLGCLLLYVCLWIYLIKRWYFHLKTKSIYFVSYSLSLCVFLVMSMVSQLVLYVSYFLYFVMYWATVEALCENSYKYYKSNRLQKLVKN